MGADDWLAPGTCGVKLAEFDQLTRQMSRAAPGLSTLADQLWQALHSAGVSTAPAEEIRRLAAWAAEASTDLRRRNVLAHDLDHESPALKTCLPGGTYLTLPDRYSDQTAYMEGRRIAARLGRGASPGITAADLTPALARGLLDALGPAAMLDLARRAGAHAAANPGDVRLNADTRALHALLGRGLALTTDPHGPSYVGDPFLTALTAAGRATSPPRSAPPAGWAGYQTLSTLIGASGARFSPAFFARVGSDMIAFDSTVRHDGRPPLPDLTPGHDHLINLLDAAARSGPAAAQALLSHQAMGPFPKGWTNTTGPNYRYLLHDRRDQWARSDHGAALGRAIQTATTGQDPESTRLTFALGKTLATDAKGYFEVGKDGHLEIKGHDDAGLDAMSGVRQAMAMALAKHIIKVNDIFQASGNNATDTGTPMSDVDMDYLLLYVARDSASFTTLLNAQTAHAKVVIDQAVARDSRYMVDVVDPEGKMFGHLLEARTQNLWAEKARVDQVNDELRSNVEMGVGLFSPQNPISDVPVAGKAVDIALELSVESARKQIVDLIVRQREEGAKVWVTAPTTDGEALEKLFSQLILSSIVAHGRYAHRNIAGASFATPGPHPKIKPVASMTPTEFISFLRWAGENSDSNHLSSAFADAADQGRRRASGHYVGVDGVPGARP
ncbi:hypothetical protein [Actinomadura parmotrematis]|uniref:Uncharacterized protein n=1 Tax=Actinomadura parmotrematis TaxID=2864039 RepID=A0ABS7FWA5_9ACTN|nr:hypothetical protein [Actinomadura parmotrematis]MBW8484713.1 hypothetical protein [Actinomadura parmotrematis]